MSTTRRAAHRGAWLAAVVLVLGACGSGGGSSETSVVGTGALPGATTAPPGTATAVATTSPATTVALTTTTTATTPTEATPTACAERSPTRPLVVDEGTEAALATFRPLASAPAIVLDVQPPELPIPEAAAVSVHRIPGGLLVVSRPGPYLVDPMPATPTTLTALDWDGTVRWIRCLADPYPNILVAEAADRPDAALVAATTYAGGTMRTAWSAVSLDDGHQVPAVAERFAALQGGAALRAAGPTAGRWLLAGPEDAAAGGDLARIDLVTLVPTPVPRPPVDDPVGASLDVTTDGEVVAFDRYIGGAVLTTWRDGRWRTGAAPAALGRRVAFVPDAAGQRGRLRGIDVAGRVRWTVPDRFEPGLQATGTYVVGDTAIAQTCEPIDDSTCTHRLTAVDVGSGAVRWELPGLRLLAGMPADGLALVSEGAIDTPSLRWALVDTRTGEPVAGQAWDDPRAFSHPCCGASEYDSTERHGGVVVVVEGRSVRVWLPADVGLAGWTRRLG